MQLSYVFALSSSIVNWKGRAIQLREGMPWSDQDPFVKDNPDLFSRKPPIVYGTGSQPVERATKVPGEKRPRR